MYQVKIINDDGDQYVIDIYDQDPKVAGPTPHEVVVNDGTVGHIRHDREDGPWALAQRVLSTFPATETLKEQGAEGGAHTAFRPSPGALRKALDAYRDELVYGEAEASAQLADASQPRERLIGPQGGDQQ